MDKTPITHQNIAKKLVEELKLLDIGCYVWHVATTGSVYIRFDDCRMASIRIGNHDGREHLKYKYNLRDDIGHLKWVKDGEIWRLYVPTNRWKEIIPFIVGRRDKVKEWKTEGKYKYTIPSFKKES